MSDSWYLIADIGGTNARFAMGDPCGDGIRNERTMSVADHPSFMSALQAYLEYVHESGDWTASPEAACLAVACPANREVISFTNSDWVIHRDDVALALSVPKLHVINDFAAIGHAVTALDERDWRQLGDGTVESDQPIAVLGPGTGLGVCGVLPEGRRAHVIAGEGGHVDFAPVSDEEVEILRRLRTRFRRVSAERLLSGAGLSNIYWALTTLRDAQHRHASPADISAAALANDDPVAVEALEVFCRVLGAAAGNLALTFGARGGVYIAGGIAPRIVDFMAAGDFRERFLAKGRFRDYLNDIPTRVITRSNPGLCGALRLLKERH